MKTSKYYKLAKLDGWDFRTGNTINYRENLGKTVTVPTFTFCGNVLFVVLILLHHLSPLFTT